MASHFEDFLDKTQATTDLAALTALFRDAMAVEGYDNIVFARSAARSASVQILAADCPAGYAEMYWGRKYDAIDPILRQSYVAKHPFVWDRIVDSRHLTREQKAFFAECQDIGVHGGLTMPFHNPGGGTHMMSVSLRDGPKPDPRRIPYIYALAAQTWARHSVLDSGDLPEPVAPIRLTSRECECLKWAKDGKTNWEISQIISVAERTVEFHIGNAMRKLNATNRVTAIVIAIQEGLVGI